MHEELIKLLYQNNYLLLVNYYLIEAFGLSFSNSRLLTALMNVPAIVIAAQQINNVQLSLVLMLISTVLVPVIVLGFW